MILVRARYGGSALSFLLAGGNWNGGRYAGPGCRYANYAVSASARDLGARVEFRPPEGA